MINISEEGLDFKTFERNVFDVMCGVARKLMRKHLELRDLTIMAMRDMREYRHVGKRETTIKTLMGEVTFSRRYYKDSSGRYVFLLDEAIGIKCGCGLYSENLVEQVIGECLDKSFRKAAGSISSLTGQSISAMGAWGILQSCGGMIGQHEARLQELYESGSVGHLGNAPTAVLFEEYDDVWLSIQKPNRKKCGERNGGEPDASDGPQPEQPGASDGSQPEQPGASDGSQPEQSDASDGPQPEQPDASDGPQPEQPEKPKKKKLGKKPMHIGTAYTGWSQGKDGRFSTANKIAYATFGDSSEFTSLFETLLQNCFDMETVEKRVTNGDGESWIRTRSEDVRSILQLDPFHRDTAIIKAVSDKGSRDMVFGAIGDKDVGKALGVINGMIMTEQDENKRKRLTKLYEYFDNNKDILLTWQERGVELPAPPEGISYRNLGTQESSNCNLLTLRMKNRKGSWSISGANNMAKILCLKKTIGLDAFLGDLPEPLPIEEYAEPLSAAEAPMFDGKGYGAGWLYAPMPFEQASRTNGREAIINMLRLKPISSLPLILGAGSNKPPMMIPQNSPPH